MFPHFPTGRRRLAELKEHRESNSIIETIGMSRSTLIINMVIECASGIVFIVGLAYLVRFFIHQKHHIDPALYTLWFSIILLVSFLWFVFFVVRLRHRYTILKKYSSENEIVVKKS
jgi:hypothetical protein